MGFSEIIKEKIFLKKKLKNKINFPNISHPRGIEIEIYYFNKFIDFFIKKFLFPEHLFANNFKNFI